MIILTLQTMGITQNKQISYNHHYSGESSVTINMQYVVGKYIYILTPKY